VKAPSPLPRLTDIVEAIAHIQAEMTGVSLDTFEADWRRRWLVERGIEIISEASRRLPDELKAQHPEIPWRKVADIGNILRHEYQRVDSQIIWNAVKDDLPALKKALLAIKASLTE
jgi:uncharacterized protein with HEPN domain